MAARHVRDRVRASTAKLCSKARNCLSHVRGRPNASSIPASVNAPSTNSRLRPGSPLLGWISIMKEVGKLSVRADHRPVKTSWVIGTLSRTRSRTCPASISFQTESPAGSRTFDADCKGQAGRGDPLNVFRINARTQLTELAIVLLMAE